MPETTTPDTLSYLILGLIVAFTLPSLYLISLFVRHYNLERDMKLIEQLKDEK